VKWLLISVAIIGGALYLNGPPNAPIITRMKIGLGSFIEQSSPTLCSNSEALDQVVVQI
jgi:hypothetical protein